MVATKKLFFITSCFALGILVASFWTVSPTTLSFLLLLALLLGLIYVREKRGVHSAWVLIGSIVLVSFVAGVFRLQLADLHWEQTGHGLDNLVGETVTLEGVIAEPPESREATQRLVITTSEVRVIVSTERYQDLAYGDQVTVIGKLKKPETIISEDGRTFDYAGYLKAKNIAYQISFAQVEVTSSGHGQPVLALIYRQKYAFMNALESVLSEPEAGLGEGLLLGVKQSLGVKLEEDFRRTGIIHIVVLSGYNVMIVVAFMMFILSLFLGQRGRIIGGVIGIMGFALLVGLSATVLRASIMAVLGLLALFWGRSYDVMRALFIAGMIMLLFNPDILVHDVGFQLSFMATFGLILSLPNFENILVAWRDRVGIKEIIMSTVATQIAVLPLLLYQMGQLSFVAVAVNALVLPVVSFAMLGTFVTGLTAVASPTLALVPALPTNFFLGYIIMMAEWWSALPFATANLPVFSALWLMVAYGLLTAVFIVGRRMLKNYHTKKMAREKSKMSTISVDSQEQDLSRWQVVTEAEWLVGEAAEPSEDLPSPGSAAASVPKTLPVFFQ